VAYRSIESLCTLLQGKKAKPKVHFCTESTITGNSSKTPDVTWKAGKQRHQPCQGYNNAQGRAKQKAYRGQTKRNNIPLKRVEYNAYQAKHWKSIPSMLMGETQPQGTGARETRCDQSRKDDQGQLHPSPSLGLANHAWQNHARQTRRRWKLWKWPAAQQTPA
jgi:hypothetical protein